MEKKVRESENTGWFHRYSQVRKQRCTGINTYGPSRRWEADLCGGRHRLWSQAGIRVPAVPHNSHDRSKRKTSGRPSGMLQAYGGTDNKLPGSQRELCHRSPFSPVRARLSFRLKWVTCSELLGEQTVRSTELKPKPTHSFPLYNSRNPRCHLHEAVNPMYLTQGGFLKINCQQLHLKMVSVRPSLLLRFERVSQDTPSFWQGR